MRRFLLFLLLFHFSYSALFAQSNGNGWIDYDQQYFRMKIALDGIYRIDKNMLLEAGFPVNIDPRRIQVFGKEQEQAIYVQGENDGQFDDEDFIEFYAKANDGWLDSLLYEDPEFMLNPHYSLYNDTLCYYLSYSDANTINNLRAISISDQNFDGYPSSEFCYTEEIKFFNSSYGIGDRHPTASISEPRYLEGEGYGKNINNGTENLQFNTNHRYSAAGAPATLVRSCFASNNNPVGSTSNGNHHYKLSVDGNTLFDSTFYGYKTFPIDESISTQGLTNSTQVSIGRVNDLGVSNDYMILGFMALYFPHNYNFEGNSEFSFRPKANANEKLKIELSNLEGTSPIVYSHGQNTYRGRAYADTDQYRFLIPQNGEDYFHCFISATESIQTPSSIEKVNNSGYFTDFQSQNLSNAFLIISHPSLMTEASNYAAYRNSTFSSLLINIEELYDQYGGGIQKHPLAIKRMLKDLFENWDESPSNLFLIGKSINPNAARVNEDNYVLNLIPTIGHPPSDNLLSAGLNGTVLEPALPTGRLAAKTPADVSAYLDKVIAFESQEPAMWMKNFLHFGGGANTSEQTQFKNNLASYEAIAEDTSMGALVSTFLKNSSTPIEIVVNEEITALINGGVSLMTFFGHASGSGFDINIDQPENYENYGKYPLILASSCYTGNIHTTNLSNSENFVLIPEKGSIAYIATVNTGLADQLHSFNQKFYTHSFKSHYNTSLGQNLIRAIQDMPDSPIQPFVKESTCLEMTIHGDPSLILNAFEKPDFEITVDDISFTPEELTADVDSFQVNIYLKNIAKATHQSFNIELIRHFPGNLGDSIYFKTVNGLLNYDSLSFTLASHHPLADGINTFDILLDHSSPQVDEIDNSGNNTVYGKEYLVKSSQIVPVYPYDQSIIGNQGPTFSAYAGSLSSALNTYQFQLSLDENFNQIIDEGSVSISDGVVFWNPNVNLIENSVYFWRTASEEDAMENNWRPSSFEFIEDSSGWGQSSPYQFDDNQFHLLDFDAENNALSFIEGSKQLNCLLVGNVNTITSQVLLDLNVVDYAGCAGSPWIQVMVFDPNTLEAWGNNYGGANPDHEFGNVVNCVGRNRVEFYFAFKQSNEAQMQSLYQMLDEAIPDGHHILVYTFANAQFDNWNQFEPQLFTLFSDWGSNNINVNSDDLPFIFYTQKGDPSTSSEIMATVVSDTISLLVDLPITGNTGSVSISDMGRTEKINSAQWTFSDSQSEDEFDIELTQDNNVSAPYYSEEPSFDQVINLDRDPSHPNKAKLTFVDTLNYSPLQFEHLRLFYTPFGDAAINANAAYSFYKDTLQEGEEIKLILGLSNPTPYAMDSLLTKIQIVNSENLPVYSKEIRLDSLEAYENRIDSIFISSIGLFEGNTIVYEVNPLNAMAIADQPEQHRFNNKISIPFYVKSDEIQPIVDVTFDGMHIMNGEIISPESQLVVQLKDNSEYLVFSGLSDTTNLAIFIQDPNGELLKLNYNDPKLSYEFGTEENNQFKVIYNPKFDKDGIYKLLVQAKDKSGNSTGSRDYEIEFEIIHKTAITQVLNYPNPFVDKTHFVFTLTGVKIPDVFTIRIYSVSGRLVKEIHKQELGSLRIGHNVTDYYWDGTDMYGDRLANGVYFYKVDIQFYDRSLEHIESEVDQYFKMGMGKMYLMR